MSEPKVTLYDGKVKEISSNHFYVSSDRLSPGAESPYTYYLDDPNHVFTRDPDAQCEVAVEDADYED